MKRFVLQVEGGVEPMLVGPFKSAKKRDRSARKIRNANEEDGVFWLNVTSKGRVDLGAYTNGFMEDEEGFEGSEA